MRNRLQPIPLKLWFQYGNRRKLIIEHFAPGWTAATRPRGRKPSKKGLPVGSALTMEYRKRKNCFTQVPMCKWLTPNSRPYGGALQTAALLDCGGSTPSGSRYPVPIRSRFETHLDTPSLERSQSTITCPVLCPREPH